ncbi:MAG: triose-phosphate isomerase [Myxococcota bacterium]|nr:triose-phosphate isomerase [Myxococcota bacterium]
MRRFFIAGNWKMNKSPAESERFAAELKKRLLDINAVDIAVSPTALSLGVVTQKLKHTNIDVSAQNMHDQSTGAFTGEVSGEMLREAGVTYVILGHSERRHKFQENDSFIQKKVEASFRCGLLPILCVGETLEQRQSGQAASVTLSQVEKGLAGLSADQVAAVTIAYEPVWAIGTGHTATPQQAQEMHAIIRSWLKDRYPDFVHKQLRIQYGGSVKPHNALSLLEQPDIDGALIGGASLKIDSFVAIIETAAQLSKG